MQLILRPVSGSPLKEIIVTDSRFAIGRNEDHFRNYERSIIAKLSRRHARIFERDGAVFIADLHSSNGTTVNGQPVEGEPIQIRLNDEVQFGGLRYRVEHLGGADAVADRGQPDVEAKVVLKPTRTDDALNPIVVSKFPFLVSRYGDVFAGYQESIPQHLSFISKKHAHFFVHQNAVYVEDLGSTNGTYVCGEELTEKARRLNDKDTIAFGGDRFVYDVQIFIGRDTVAEAEARIERLAEGTIFVDDATNFFEIYMGAGDDEEEEPQDAGTGAAGKGTDSKYRSRNTRFGRALRFFDEIRSSLHAGEPVDRRLRWTITVSLVCLVAGIAGYWYIAWPVQQVNELFESQKYPAAAELANDYLRRRPDDERLQDLATEATLKSFVPEWQAAIQAGHLTIARQALENARQTGLNNSTDDELIAVLELATEFSTLETSVYDKNISVDMLSGDSKASTVVEQWDSKPTANARALSRIELQVEGFDVYRAEFFRRLRAMREREKDLEPFNELRTNLVDALANRDTSRLRQHVREFSQKRSEVRGLDLLQEDLLRYEAVEEDISDARWLRAYERTNESEFNTAPFADHAGFMNENILPDAPTRDSYARAADAWKEGDTPALFELLTRLAKKPWGEVASRDLERNRSLLNTLAELQANRDATDFEDRLFTLYGQLDPERDIYLRRALQPDFQRHSQAALERAADRTRRAEEAWKNYDQSGRLNTVHRLQERVSTEYKNLAGLLTVAYQNLRESKGIYQQLDTRSPDSWTDLNREVVQEIKIQTGALSDLLVIEPDVQKAKLGLLPNLSSS